MAASYPTSAKSFSSKSTTDVVEAAHVNDLQDEVTAVEAALLTSGFAHALFPSTSGTRDLGTSSLLFRTAYLDTALILGAATTSGVRLDLEAGVLAVREGDDSAYGALKALTLEATSNAVVGGTLAVTGATTLSSTLGVTGLATAGWVPRSIAYTAADTTPSVLNASRLVIANAGAVTITNFDDGVDGQIITLKFSDSNTTITRFNASLSGGVNFTSTDGDTLTLQNIGGVWYEISRSVNA